MIYFDNSATTRPSQKCIQAMIDAMDNRYANASALHHAGVESKRDITACKEAIAQSLGCNPGDVLLGPSGTFCNNLAVKSTVKTLRQRGNKIVISSLEHPSVRESVRSLEEDGFEFCLCNPLTDDFKREIDDKTILVSCMCVNNETGLILPVEKLKSIIKSKNSPALLHIDAVQAFGKIQVSVRKLDCDFLTVSAHKINGPKGIAALYVRRGVRVVPLIFGGEQENSLVPGTYNSPAAAGFAAAVSELSACDKEHYDKLYDHFVSRVSQNNFMHLNTFGQHAGHIINVSFDGYLGENILHFLEEYEIYTSQGSACSSHSKNKTFALTALGADKRTSDSSLRISFDRNNTISEIDKFFEVCKLIPDRLIRVYR